MVLPNYATLSVQRKFKKELNLENQILNTMKKQTKSQLATLAVILVFPFQFLFAQRDIKGELNNDLVQIKNGYYAIEEYGLIASFDKEYEVKISASAPITLMSRDNFVRYYGAFSSSIFSTWMSQEGIKAPDDLLLVRTDKPGANIDLTVTIEMNEKGIDYVVQSENSNSKMNIQWQYQLFTDPPPRN